MTSPEIIWKATDLSLGYAQRTVLRGVHLEVRSGEFWFCLGRNGAGKSTLLRAMLGTHRPQAGSVWCHPELRGRQRIGFVPQRCDLNPALPTTVREFVLLGTVGTAIPRSGYATHLHWALAHVGLEGMAAQSYWSLSGGQRQRALVARALVRRPRLLILDEPTSGFDLPTTEAFLHCLASFHRHEGVTLFFVTHDLTMLGRYATHLLLLGDGRAVAGPYQELHQQRAVERIFGLGTEALPSAAAAVTPASPPGGSRA